MSSLNPYQKYLATIEKEEVVEVETELFDDDLEEFDDELEDE